MTEQELAIPEGKSVEMKTLSKVIGIKETFDEQEERIRKQSPFGNLKTWKLMRIIVKAGDDMR